MDSLAILIIRLRQGDWHERRRAADRLVQIGSPAVKAIVEVLKDQDPDVRSLAIGILGKIGDAHAIEALVNILESGPSRLVADAAFALGTEGNTRAVDPLIQILLHSFDYETRLSAAQALGHIGDRRALASLEIEPEWNCNPIVSSPFFGTAFDF